MGRVIFGRRRAQRAISRALVEHETFELAHREKLARVHKAHELLKIGIVDLGEGKTLIRQIGEYDRDQKLDRIEGLVREDLRWPPRKLRALIEKML